MKKIIYVCVLTIGILSSCSTNGPVYNIPEKESSGHISFNHYKQDTIGYCKYKTFDELKMKGVGTVSDDCYVLVKRINDTIIVKSSLVQDSMRVYYKLSDDIWYNYIEYEMWKKNDYTLCKCIWDKPARTYARYIYNDTILELKTIFLDKRTSMSMIVKTLDKVFCIDSFNTKLTGKELLSEINNYLSKGQSVTEYNIVKNDTILSYVPFKKNSQSYHYRLKSYGLWGAQPGLDETCLYAGQDIRCFDTNHPNGTVSDIDDTVYELADTMPRYKDGTAALFKAIHIKEGKNIKTNNRLRIVVSVIVEKDGSLSSISVIKPTNEEYDNKAIDIVKKLKHFTPAFLDGQVVRCKFLIPVTFENI